MVEPCYDACTKCDGAGGFLVGEDGWKDCDACQGTGMMEVEQ
jgi:DnaJ-class molecular chaperone